MPLKTREGVELARVGTWNTSTGKWTCTREQIADAVRAGQSGHFRNPVLIRRGHVDPQYASDATINADGEPALGMIKNLRAGRDGDSLVGDVLMQDWLDEELDAIYPSRSVEADLGVETPDGEKYSLVLTGMALLGVTKPAIQSLAELPERVAASEYTAAMSIAAGFFDESAHPRGGKGTSAGGKFVAKGSGYGDKKDGQGRGDEADTVREVQEQLIRLGLLSKDSGRNSGKDGLFGPRTEAAVKKWQRTHGHAETGKVSPQLLKTLKLAKPGDHGQAQRKADHPKKPISRGTTVLRHTKLIKAAADEVAEPLGLDVREITTDSVVFDDAHGRVWLSAWTGDEDTLTVTDPAPAVVAYTKLAASAEGLAVHALHRGTQYVRGWDAHEVTASLGDETLDITPQLREALGVDENADEAAVLAAVERLKTSTVEPPAATTQEPALVEPVATPAAQNDPLDAPVSAPNGSVTASEDVKAFVAAQIAAAMAPVLEANTALKTEVGTLSGELATRKAKEADDHKTRLLASAVADGKITPAERESWSKRYDNAPAVIEEILGSYARGKAMPVMASGYAGDGTETTDDFAEFEKIWGAS